MTALPAAGYFSDPARTNAEAKTAQDDMLAFVRQMLGGQASTELTIASGAAVPTRGMHTIDTEADAASDDLTNLDTTNLPDGSWLLVGCADAARVVTVKHNAGGAGQIALTGAADAALDATSKYILLRRSGANWAEIGRFGFIVESELLKQGRHTIWVPAVAMIPRTTNGAASGSVETTTNKVMLKTLDFDASTIEYAQFAIRMPKGWDEGTVAAVFVWSHAATTTNFKVSWGLQAVAISDDDALDAAFGTAQYANDTGGTTNDAYASPETSAITIAGTPAAEDLVIFQVLRKADDGTNDTLAVDARLHGVTLYYTVNAPTDA